MMHAWQTYQLVCQHQHRLQAELSIAKVEQVLQGRPHQIYHHDVVVALDAVPPDVRDSDYDAAGMSVGDR
eukprot:313180-Chlamydomonas_euryale.AAC.5